MPKCRHTLQHKVSVNEIEKWDCDVDFQHGRYEHSNGFDRVSWTIAKHRPLQVAHESGRVVVWTSEPEVTWRRAGKAPDQP